MKVVSANGIVFLRTGLEQPLRFGILVSAAGKSRGGTSLSV